MSLVAAVTVTHYNDVIVPGKHLRFVIGRHIAGKRLQVSCKRLLS